MEAPYWLDKWEQGQIGFHQPGVNSQLLQTIDKLPPQGRILVPLCGKSEDLWWLAQRGYDVVGIELAEQALRAFFDEHQVSAKVDDIAGARRFRYQNISLWQADMLTMDAATLGQFDLFYDRAALVALPAALRSVYAGKMRELLSPSAQGLVVTLVYDQQEMAGPPFSVSAEELAALYPQANQQCLQVDNNALADNAKFRQRGVSALSESVYLVRFGQ